MRVVLAGAGAEQEIAASIARALPHATIVRADADDAERAAGDAAVELVVLAPALVHAPDATERVRRLRRAAVAPPILAVGRADGAALAVALMKAGVTDYLGHGDGEALVDAVRALTAPVAAPRAGEAAVPGLVGPSRAMAEVRALVRVAAKVDAHVLVEGETGTGKEVVARAIHALGRRAARPFVPVNCAAIPETLAESEFFGHARGAFTGAVQERPGTLRLADGGTLFLDEIEDLPLALQAKLLRVVQDREVRPVGGSVARRIDVRIVAASNRDLWQMVEAGAFRSDLYYRLRVLTVRVPPLRDRREDIPALVAHFVARFNQRHATSFAVPGEVAYRPLLEHPWAGNVRELENTLEALLTLAQATDADLAGVLRRRPPSGGGFWADERTRILRVLEANRWNRQRAAAALGISRVTLWRRMERHGIRDPLGTPTHETG